MFAFLVKRTLATVPVLLIVAVLVFLLLRLTPGDPAAIIAGDAASPENVAKIRENLGLSKPLIAQFGIWFGNKLGARITELARLAIANGTQCQLCLAVRYTAEVNEPEADDEIALDFTSADGIGVSIGATVTLLARMAPMFKVPVAPLIGSRSASYSAHSKITPGIGGTPASPVALAVQDRKSVV